MKVRYIRKKMKNLIFKVCEFEMIEVFFIKGLYEMFINFKVEIRNFDSYFLRVDV